MIILIKKLKKKSSNLSFFEILKSSHPHHLHDNQKVHTLADSWRVQRKLVTANLSQISSSPHGRLSLSLLFGQHDINLMLLMIMIAMNTAIMITLSELIMMVKLK